MLLLGCGGRSLPVIKADVITEKTRYDADDPAIWINPEDPSQSIVFGTDKDTDGAVFAFDLNGKIIRGKTITGLKRPNNVDVEYGFSLNDSTVTDILVFTERERQMLRVYSVPSMEPLDNGGFKVFEDASIPEYRLPMGIGMYKSPDDHQVYAIVGRKDGPKENYLYQYLLVMDEGRLHLQFVRKIGAFSGKKEIEAIAVDDEAGFIFYADEGVCIRKYYADQKKGK